MINKQKKSVFCLFYKKKHLSLYQQKVLLPLLNKRALILGHI